MQYTSSWRSPSNIALIKYWGKHGIQLPRNPSLSFTLSVSHTDMTITVIPDVGNPQINVLYNGVEQASFVPKISSYFQLLKSHFKWIGSSHITIDSINTFPHGAGIASSASAMSALALCLYDIHAQINDGHKQNENWRLYVSEIARLGSGSASRSLFPTAALWGKAKGIGESNDEFAIPWKENISSIYQTYHDTILIVSASEKKVSSSAGHNLMTDLPYAKTRYKEAESNLLNLTDIMRDENKVNEFISVCESEALQLHALMLMGKNPYVLIEPNTLSIIKEVWNFRRETNTPVCFTLDAGPNVHLLYPDKYKIEVIDFIQSRLKKYCINEMIIWDKVGEGPVRLNQ